MQWSTYGQISEGSAQMMAVLCVETSAVDQIHAASDNVACGECRTVRLAVARRAKRVAIVAVIAERLLVPAYSTHTHTQVKKHFQSLVLIPN